jgi:hypothetical protein
MKILFLNHKLKQCGVYQYGIRLYNILKKSENIEYIYKEIDSIDEYNHFINEMQYDGILYNFHGCTMNWLNDYTIQRKIKNIAIIHESNNDLFEHIIDIEKIDDNYVPRPIFENIEEIVNNTPTNNFIESYTSSNIPIFGSFGFGFNNKGFEKIVKMINEHYDEAIIKFLIPPGDFAHCEVNELLSRCKSNITKPNIILIICNDFLSNNEVLKFLHSNTLNIFLYDKMDGRGLSSAIDYAISVKKPFGISDSAMFRNIYSDEICLYNVSIEDCIKNSEKYIEKMWNDNCNAKLIMKIDSLIQNTITLFEK